MRRSGTKPGKAIVVALVAFPALLAISIVTVIFPIFAKGAVFRAYAVRMFAPRIDTYL